MGLDLARVAGAEWQAWKDPCAVGGFLCAPPMALVGALLSPNVWVAWAAAELAMAIALAPRSATEDGRVAGLP